jgi:hypothetical protein
MRDVQPAGATYQRGARPGVHRRQASEREVSGVGVLASVLLMLAGLVTFLGGLAAAVGSRHYYRVPSDYPYLLSAHTWGWILLALGVLMFASGASYLLGMAWARAAGISLAVLTSIAAFLFLPYTPVLAVVLILASFLAIWGLLRFAGHRESALPDGASSAPASHPQRTVDGEQHAGDCQRAD